MKKILALILACTMLATSSLCVCAATGKNTQSGSSSVTAKDIEELRKQIEDLLAQIESLKNALTAGGDYRGGSSAQQNAAYAQNNLINYGGFIIGQGGHVEINGGRSNVTFRISMPNSSQITSANQLAASVGGAVISCVNTSSPGATFATAKVNFYLSGVQTGDNIAVYQLQGKNWVQLPTPEIRKDHVVVNMTQHGTLAFIKVPVLAAASY